MSAATTLPPPTANRSVSAPRLVGIDVVRAVALIGVVVMNYHGYLNAGAGTDTFFGRLFHPWVGVLSTRFAATFVTVAGVGVVLLTNRSRLSRDPVALDIDRWRLRRRGVLLYAGGYVLDWIWPGTILFYYGALFVVASFIFTLRIRWLVAIGAASALVAAAVQWWAFERSVDGHGVTWLLGSSGRSPRSLFFDTILNGTHPLFPWLAFLCAGMVIGRLLPEIDRWRWRLVGLGVVFLAGGYGLSSIVTRLGADGSVAADRAEVLGATDPFNRGLLYTIVTLGSSLIAVLMISWLAERSPDSTLVDVLRRAGQMSLTLYLLHVVVFNVFVNTAAWVTPTGLDTALLFAIGFWVIAILFAAWWNRFLGMGPFERIYRRFGG
ncbi:MAG TPA: DUF418 domain-containing protein [Ilumatobacteraceae bacterium]